MSALVDQCIRGARRQSGPRAHGQPRSHRVGKVRGAHVQLHPRSVVLFDLELASCDEGFEAEPREEPLRLRLASLLGGEGLGHDGGVLFRQRPLDGVHDQRGSCAALNRADAVDEQGRRAEVWAEDLQVAVVDDVGRRPEVVALVQPAARERPDALGALGRVVDVPGEEQRGAALCAVLPLYFGDGLGGREHVDLFRGAAREVAVHGQDGPRKQVALRGEEPGGVHAIRVAAGGVFRHPGLYVGLQHAQDVAARDALHLDARARLVEARHLLEELHLAFVRLVFDGHARYFFLRIPKKKGREARLDGLRLAPGRGEVLSKRRTL